MDKNDLKSEKTKRIKANQPDDVAKFIKEFQLRCEREERIDLTSFCKEYNVSFDVACVLVESSIVRRIARSKYAYISDKQPSLDMAVTVLKGVAVRRQLKKMEKDSNERQKKENEGKLVFLDDKDKRIKELELELNKKDKELSIKNNELSILSYHPMLKREIIELINEYNLKCPTNMVSRFILTMDSGQLDDIKINH